MSDSTIAAAQNLGNATEQFLAALWPDEFDRAFICGEVGGHWTDMPVGTIAEALAECRRRGDVDLYMSCATFSAEGGRTASNAKSARAFWLDLDCGEAKAEASAGYLKKRDALDALAAFCAKIGLPSPSIIDSGNGLHAYWFLESSIATSSWLPIAKQIKRITHEYGLLADPACTADIARVLRVPGSSNHKSTDNPKEVKLKRLSPAVSADFFTAAIEQACKVLPEPVERKPAFLLGEASGNLAMQLDAPETTENVNRLNDALAHIPPDVSRDEWRQIIWATLAHGWTCAETIARDWSMRGEKWSEPDFAAVVRSFNPLGGTGPGTPYHLAAQHGWAGAATERAGSDAVHVEKIATAEPGDMSAARVFARLNAGKLLYVTQAGRWLTWTGTRWSWCNAGEDMQAAKQTADHFLKLTIELVRQDAERHRKRLAFALRLQNLPRLEAMMRLAQSEPGLCIGSMTELDADPWMLGVRNGAIDLKRGALLSPDPRMLITRQAGTEFDRSAECPRWLQFLDSIFSGDAQTIKYIQRALGYSLTASTTEEVLFLAYGWGANGKSVFANIVSSVLGDYAQAAPAALLTTRREGDAGPRNDVARLCGARVVNINELQNGEVLDEQVVKMLAGRELIAARFLHKEYFDFLPSAKAWIRTNHRPVIHGTDDGIWRRLHLVPFKRKFAEDERDPWLEGRLADELPGILAWMVDGCLEWQKIGLSPSPLVRSESATYRTESDLLGEFLQDECVLDSNSRESQRIVFSAWCIWCANNAVRNGSKASFSRKLHERGIVDVKNSGTRFYAGLKLGKVT